MLRPMPLLLTMALTCIAQGCTLSDDHAACSAHPLFQELVADQGTLQVIVTLSGEPTETVTDLQDRLLNELEGTELEVVRRYDNFPLLTLRVGAAALCRLLASPLVEAIQVDGDEPPTEG